MSKRVREKQRVRCDAEWKCKAGAEGEELAASRVLGDDDAAAGAQRGAAR
jgi:hypothetical protein